MNLQVCAPHQECVYNCPFCVARGHKHKYHFKDIYKDGLNQDYFNALKRTIKTCNIDTVIITGECDPTQNMLCHSDAVSRWTTLRVLINLPNLFKTKSPGGKVWE